MALIAVGSIAWLTLVPDARQAPPVQPHFSWSLGGTDIVNNILLFAPLGLGLALAGQGVARACGAGLLLSTAIELAQWRFLPERYASLGDICANTAGCALGYLGHAVAPALLRPSRGAARLLVLSWATVWVAICFFTAWVLQPELPQTTTWWGQWAHHFPGTVPLRGRVLSFTVNSWPIPDDPLTDTRAFRAGVAEHGAQLEVQASGLMPVDGRAQVAAVVDGEGNMVMAIEQEGCMLRAVARRRADHLGFGAPALNLPVSCSGALDTIDIAATIKPQYMRLVQRAPGGERSAQLTLRPTLGWWLLIPRPSLVVRPVPFTLLWIGVLLAPLAYWANGLTSSPTATLACLATFGLGVVALCAATFQLHAPDAVDALGVVGGLLTGWGGGSLLRTAPPNASDLPPDAL